MKSSNIGGQAVMEGIMMRHGEKYSVAVRKPDQEIAVQVESYQGILPCKKILSIPIVRGVFNFIDSLVLGTKCLMYSATFFEEDEEDAKKREALTEEEQKKEEEKQKRQENLLMTGTVIFSVVLSVGLFMVLPYLIASLLRTAGAGEYLITVAEAFIRILLFLGYLVLISRMEDIQRVFMYHGAEHKTIRCYEAQLPLTVENVRPMTRKHPRCGTSFLLVVICISILVGTVIRVDNTLARMGIHLLLLPVIVAVSYEFNRLVGRHDNRLTRILTAPGQWMQNFTTQEPDDSMIEVAIKALEEVLPSQEGADQW